jgi:hypothetical protein
VAEVLALAGFGRRDSECRPCRTRTGSALSHAPPAGTNRVPSNWLGLAHCAPTSDVHGRRPSTGAVAPATTSATGASARGGAAVNTDTQGDSALARFRSGGVHTQNACCLVRSDDSHRQRAGILT